MKYMLDTNICIYAIKNRDSSVIGKLRQNDPHEICISAVTYAELMHGVEKSQFPEKNRLALLLFLAPFEILELGAAAAECYGRIRSVLERKGTPIGPMDMLIAAHAMAEGLTVVTNNVREFKRIEGISLENWAGQE